MGNRESLLEGAKRCLLEKGYGRTTARDIADAAGVSLAAIGYHFGTKEALLNAALKQALQEWGDTVEHAATPGDPAESFDTVWDRVVQSLPQTRALWAVQFELLAHLNRNPELRQSFTEANRAARLGLLQLFGLDSEDEKLGAYLQMLLIGAAAQALTEPDSSLSGSDLRKCLQAMAATLKR